MRFTILLCIAALALCACRSKPNADLLPSDGSAWNHNYVIINPVVQPGCAATQPQYPPCQGTSKPQVPQMGVKPQSCFPKPAPSATLGDCKDGQCRPPWLVMTNYGPGDEQPLAPQPPDDIARPGTKYEEPTVMEKRQPPSWAYVVFAFIGLLLGMAAASRRMHWGVRVGAMLFIGAGILVFLTGCSSFPLSLDSGVTEGDMHSYVGKAVQGAGITLEGLLGMMGGGGVLGAAIVRLLRGSAFKSGSGRQKLAADAAKSVVVASDKAAATGIAATAAPSGGATL